MHILLTLIICLHYFECFFLLLICTLTNSPLIFVFHEKIHHFVNSWNNNEPLISVSNQIKTKVIFTHTLNVFLKSSYLLLFKLEKAKHF